MCILYLGIGKTTLAEEICKKWVDGDQFLANTYEYVILIPLRWVQVRSLEEIMIEFVKDIEVYHELKRLRGSKCLIILEGLDEVSMKWQQNDETFKQLVVRKTIFESATIMITSRPHACNDLYSKVRPMARKIEIVGFSKKQIIEYIEYKFCSSLTASKFIKELEYFPHISSLCYIPLSLKMVAEIFFNNNESFPCYLTELYQKFVVLSIKRFYQPEHCPSSCHTAISDDKDLVKKLSVAFNSYNISDEAVSTVFLLCKLAYYSYFKWNESDGISKNPKIIYTKKDLLTFNMVVNLENEGFDLLKISHTPLFHDVTYNFNHISIQEYLCALYISLLPENEQSELLNEYFIEYPNVWLFYAGITCIDSSFTSTYLKKVIMQLNDDTMEQNDLIITALNCIYEAQNSNINNHMCVNQKFSINLYYTNLLPYNCISIAYFMSFAFVTHFNISRCNIRDVGARMIDKYSKPVSSLKVLNLCHNTLTSKGMQHILNIATNNLTHLLMAGNPLLDEGTVKTMPIVTKFTHITELNIAGVSMTSKAAYAIGNYLQYNNTLAFLNMSYNTIEDEGIKVISNSLSINTNSNLFYLNVTHCGFSYKGAKYIGNMLKTNASIRHLNISHNSICDDGMNTIIKEIIILNSLSTLEAVNCELTDSVGSSLLKLLTISSCLSNLDLRSNDFTASDIIEKAVQAAINNTSLCSLKIDESKLNPTALNLCAVINSREQEKVLIHSITYQLLS